MLRAMQVKGVDEVVEWVISWEEGLVDISVDVVVAVR